MHIITRAEARALGVKRYFTGSPCKYGHLAERLVSNGSCMECFSLKQKAKYHANIEEERRKQKLRRDSDPNNAAKKWARRVARDPGYAERSTSWRLANGARRKSKERGESQYFTGLPCQHGHVSKRFTSDGKCVECNRVFCIRRSQAQLDANPDLLRFRQSRQERSAVAARKKADRLARAAPWHAARNARQAAIQNGSRTYLGKPCPHGHDGLRYTSHGTCFHCAAQHSSSDEKKKYDAAYSKANREKILERVRQYHARTSEQRVAYSRKWVAENPDKRRSISKAYKARRRASEASGDPTAVIHAWESAAPKVCYWCGVRCPKLYHVDHYVPLSKGGRHEVSNLVIACRKCNLRKSAKDPYKFAASVGRLF